MTMATSITDSTRGARRTRVLMTGTLLTPQCAHKVVIRDVSPTGAQVTAPDMIQGGSLFAASRIALAEGREAGIRFYRELSEEEVDSTFHPVVLRNVG